MVYVDEAQVLRACRDAGLRRVTLDDVCQAIRLSERPGDVMAYLREWNDDYDIGPDPLESRLQEYESTHPARV